MDRERRKKKYLRNLISIAYCSLELLVVIAAFQGLGWAINRSSESEEVEKIVGSIISDSQAQTESGPLICLDAGHGGRDDGSVNGSRTEKADNLKAAQAVAAYLKQKDARVVMTRDDDTFFSLEARCEIANRSKADIFVSLHRNEGDGNGLEVWIEGKAPEETVTLATNIRNGLADVGVSRDRGVKKGTQKSENKDYYVNSHTDMPSCLIELGFINNAGDNQLFDEKLEAYAAAIGDAILASCKKEASGQTGADGGKEAPAPGSEQISPESTESGGADGSTTAPQYPKISGVETLGSQSMDWGQGSNVDEKNRPTGALTAQQQYGDKNALFIGEESQTIYLTLDEGYEYGCTPSILDTLKEKNVKAVFFVTEPYAKQEPDLVKRMIAEGHTVGNHSVTHPSAGLPSLSMEEQQKEVLENHAYIKENFGYEMHLFRYPAGKFSEQSLAIVNNCNYKSVFWSFAYLDYDVENQPDEEESLNKMIEKLHPGAVYLLHAESKTNTAVLGRFIDQVREKGYEFALIA